MVTTSSPLSIKFLGAVMVMMVVVERGWTRLQAKLGEDCLGKGAGGTP